MFICVHKRGNLPIAMWFWTIIRIFRFLMMLFVIYLLSKPHYSRYWGSYMVCFNQATCKTVSLIGCKEAESRNN